MAVALNLCQKLWINARLATMDPAITVPYGVLEEHAVGVSGGRFALIAPMRELDLDSFRGETIDARGGCLTPGLIDSHTHLVFAGQRSAEFSLRQQGRSYTEIAAAGGGILATVQATRVIDEEGLVEQSRPRMEALLREGVTTVEIKSGYGLTIEDELKLLRAAGQLAADYPVRLRRTLLAAHVVPPEFKTNPDAYIELICRELIPRVAEESLAEAVDVFCETIAFTPDQCDRVFAAAAAAGLGIKIHAEQLSNSRGAERAAVYSAWSADHLEYLDESGILALQEAGTVATLLPGAFYYLGETRKPPVALMRQHQVPMALASDLNPGSSPLASLRLMMNLGCVLFGLTPEEALAGVTRNAAAALGLGPELGMLRVGQAADMLLWELDEPDQLACEFGTTRLRQRIFAGEATDV